VIKSEDLNRLRGIGDAQSVPDEKTTSSASTTTSESQPAGYKKKTSMPEHLDAALVINDDTKCDDWGYPIVTPKDIKNGLAKAARGEDSADPS
jgi:hypothetical protein